MKVTGLARKPWNAGEKTASVQERFDARQDKFRNEGERKNVKGVYLRSDA